MRECQGDLCWQRDMMMMMYNKVTFNDRNEINSALLFALLGRENQFKFGSKLSFYFVVVVTTDNQRMTNNRIKCLKKPFFKISGVHYLELLILSFNIFYALNT